MKKRKGVSLVIFSLGAITIVLFASFVIDLGIVINAQNEFQKVLDSSVLVGASNLEPITDNGITKINTTIAINAAKETYTTMINSLNLQNANSNPTITVLASSKAIKIESDIKVDTFFIKLAGISSIEVQGQSAAMSAPVYLSNKLPQGLVDGSVISGTQGDTDIRLPVGDNKNINDDTAMIIGSPDNKALALGPGGYVTIKLPAALIDTSGADLYIRTLGNIKGYFVFAGNDIDPNNPYENEAMPGSGIKWTNISCVGVSANADNAGAAGAYYTDVIYNETTTNEAKFYGSGYYDLASKCSVNPYGVIPYDGTGLNTATGNVKSAKYLKIIDDNVEDGFISEYNKKPVLLIGDHSSITPGVNIDSLALLHHPRLISVNDFGTDKDGDGLIDVLEASIATDLNTMDTDGDGINDGYEYIGWYNNGGIQTIIDQGSTEVFMTSPTQSDATGATPIRL